jgi:Ca2+-binding EF-hand superfamily protein
MSDIDDVIKKCVDDIWKDYGKKGSDSLSKDETRKFVMETLTSMKDDEGFTEADFEACFKEFDLDGSGTIEKEEMVTFIKKVSGLI